MIKQIKKFQIKLTPFDAIKEWDMSSTNNQDLLLMDTGSYVDPEIPFALEFIDYGILDTASFDNFECDIALEQQDDDLVNTRLGLNISGLFYPQLDPINIDGTYQRVVFSQVKTMFYNQFNDPTKLWGMNNIDFTLSKTKRKISDEFRLFDTPQFIYGDQLVPNTVTLVDNSLDDIFSITDDGNGNLNAGTNLFSKYQIIGNYSNMFLMGNDSTCNDYFNPSNPPSPILIGEDMPLDQAVYIPASGSRSSFIAAARAGYMFTFDANSGNLITSSKFTNPCFSKTCLSYDSVNDKLWAGTMGDWAQGYLGDAGFTNPPSSSAALYRINPTTLTLEQRVDLNGTSFIPITGIPSSFATSLLDEPENGIYDIIIANGNLYLSISTFYPSAGGRHGMIAWMDVSSQTPSYCIAINNPPFIQLAYDNTTTPNRILGGFDGNDVYLSAGTVAVNIDGTRLFSQTNLDYEFPISGSHGAIVYSPISSGSSTGSVYQVSMTNTFLVKYETASGSVIGYPSLPGASIGGMTVKMRFNSYDNMIYIPCPATNQIIKFDPSTDTVSRIFTTNLTGSSLDAPHDIVFTPSHIFAVQYGLNGLSQIY